MNEPLLPCPRGCVKPPVVEHDENDCPTPWVLCGNNECSFAARTDDWNRRVPYLPPEDVETLRDAAAQMWGTRVPLGDKLRALIARLEGKP